MARIPTRVPTTKAPARLKMPAPKAVPEALPAARRPVASARGRDTVSVVTRMRETPVKKK